MASATMNGTHGPDNSATIDIVDSAPAMIWRADPDGRCTFFNRAWLEFTGRSREDELDWGWLENVHPEDRQRCRDARESANQNRREVCVDYRLQRYDGEYRWLADQGSPVFSANGEFHGLVGSCVDVTPRKLLAARLDQASEQLAVLVEALPDAVVFKDADGRWQLANSAARALLGLSPAEWCGRTDAELAALLPRIREGLLSLEAGDRRAWERHGRCDSVDLVTGPDGLPRYLEVSRVPLYSASGERRGLVTLGRNATERRLAEDALRLAASVFEHNPEGIMITDARQRILRVNRAFSEITGYAPEEVLGRTPSLLSSGRHEAAFYTAMWETLRRSGRWSGEIWNRRRNGDLYPEWLGIVAVTDDTGGVSNYIGTFADIAKKKDVEAEIRRLAYSDPLTGLANRRLLEERLDVEMARARAAAGSFAVLVADLDRFGVVNRAFGYLVGDAVIRTLGERLAKVVGADGLLARWHGAQFVLLLEHDPAMAMAHRAARIGARVHEAVAHPYVVDGREIDLTASLGIALFPQDADSSADLLRCAESALRDTQSAGTNAVRFYSATVDAAMRKRHALEQDLERAVARAELSLHYQPQVDSTTGAVTGAEALLRWHHPRRGWIPASDFVALAEETDLILSLGAFALEECCAQFARWKTQGLPLARLGVNVSGRQLLQPGFVADVGAILRRFDIEPAALELEMTEGALVQSSDAPRPLSQLRRMGVRIAVDDFGTGYSNLGLLKRLPVDALKIDRSFVSGMPDDAGDVAVARAICTMASCLGLRVIAEGVETAEQARLLRTMGAGELQGHFVSPALAPEDLAGFARARGGRRQEQAG